MKKSLFAVGLFAALVLTISLTSCGQSPAPIVPYAQTGAIGVGSTVFDQLSGQAVLIREIRPDGVYIVQNRLGGIEWRTATALSASVNCVAGGLCVGAQVTQGPGYPPMFVNQVFSNGMIGVAPQFYGPRVGFSAGISFSIGTGWRLL